MFLLSLPVFLVSNTKKAIAKTKVKELIPMFSSRTVIVSLLTFSFLSFFFFFFFFSKSLIHFELISMSVVSYRFNFILWHDSVQFSQCHLLKKLSFPHCVFLAPILKINWPHMHGFISGLSVLFHWLMSVFMSVPYSFDYYSFVI